VEQAVHFTLQAGLSPNVDFILGIPGEEESDALATITFMEHLADLGARIHAHSFIPLPQTPLAHAPLPILDPGVIQRLELLTSQGKAYGDWALQGKMAIRLSQFHRTEG
jgi:radical SAM superfamily enzyme YgiQ (UPF0313 family)